MILAETANLPPPKRQVGRSTRLRGANPGASNKARTMWALLFNPDAAFQSAS